MSQNPVQKERLQKIIAKRGYCSRREADRLIAAGRVRAGGQKADPGQLYELDISIKIDGHSIAADKAPTVYWMLNKPDMTLVSRRGQGSKPSIYDLPSLAKIPFSVSYVGRLDYRTEGLLIMTNDGELAHRLCHPKYKVPRHYEVTLPRRLTRPELHNIRAGVELEDGPVRGCQIRFLGGVSMGRTTGAVYEVVVAEGRNRLVRRMFDALDLRVLNLVRKRFGELKLSAGLPSGKYRQLTPTEISFLKKTVSLK